MNDPSTPKYPSVGLTYLAVNDPLIANTVI